MAYHDGRTDVQKWTTDRLFVQLDAGIRREEYEGEKKKKKNVYMTSNRLIALRRRREIGQIIGSVRLRMIEKCTYFCINCHFV